MSQRQKREHKKREDVRRQRARRHPASHIKHGAAALAAAAVIAAGTQAYASPIRLDNPDHGEAGHFHWASQLGTFEALLDVTLPADGQPADFYAYGLSTIAQDPPSYWGRTWTASPGVYYGGLKVLSTGEGGFEPQLFAPGGPIPVPGGATYYGRPVSSSSGYLHYANYPAIPEGVPSYLGVLWGGTYVGGSGYAGTSNYGWIGVTRTGDLLETFAWGYETDAGVPIAAGTPEPGSLALLAFGAGALLRRKRRA